jgi:hypothetical protein
MAGGADGTSNMATTSSYSYSMLLPLPLSPPPPPQLAHPTWQQQYVYLNTVWPLLLPSAGTSNITVTSNRSRL